MATATISPTTEAKRTLVRIVNTGEYDPENDVHDLVYAIGVLAELEDTENV